MAVQEEDNLSSKFKKNPVRIWTEIDDCINLLISLNGTAEISLVITITYEGTQAKPQTPSSSLIKTQICLHGGLQGSWRH